MICWLAKLDGAGPCDGRLIRAHLLPQQLLRREFPDGAWLSAVDEVWVPEQPEDAREDAEWPYRSLRTILRDPATWVPACGGPNGLQGHHGALDSRSGHSRALHIPREAIPEATEQFAVEFGLTWYLDRTYR